MKGVDLKRNKKKKSKKEKKHKRSRDEDQERAEESREVRRREEESAASNGAAESESDEEDPEDRLTDAQKRYAQTMRDRAAETARKEVKMTHRMKVICGTESVSSWGVLFYGLENLELVFILRFICVVLTVVLFLSFRSRSTTICLRTSPSTMTSLVFPRRVTVRF